MTSAATEQETMTQSSPAAGGSGGRPSKWGMRLKRKNKTTAMNSSSPSRPTSSSSGFMNASGHSVASTNSTAMPLHGTPCASAPASASAESPLGKGGGGNAKTSGGGGLKSKMKNMIVSPLARKSSRGHRKLIDDDGGGGSGGDHADEPVATLGGVVRGDDEPTKAHAGASSSPEEVVQINSYSTGGARRFVMSGSGLSSSAPTLEQASNPQAGTSSSATVSTATTSSSFASASFFASGGGAGVEAPPQSQTTTKQNASTTSPSPPSKKTARSWATQQYLSQQADLRDLELSRLEDERIVSESSAKRQIKERDGFCRRVDSYDGQVIVVDGKPTYEVGNYLGGGVAGVVYEGHRLRPVHEYPVRTGAADLLLGSEGAPPGELDEVERTRTRSFVESVISAGGLSDRGGSGVGTAGNAKGGGAGGGTNGSDQTNKWGTLLCNPDPSSVPEAFDYREASSTPSKQGTPGRQGERTTTMNPARTPSSHKRNPNLNVGAAQDYAVEVPAAPTDFSGDDRAFVVVDEVDAPSRSHHAARALNDERERSELRQKDSDDENDAAGGAATDNAAANVNGVGGLMEEIVAVKILNPVGFRLLAPSVAQTAVVVKEGEPMDDAVKRGVKPMTEKHVWWLVNPNSRNLRALQRKPSAVSASLDADVHGGTGSGDGSKKLGRSSSNIDRGSPDRGLRLSLVAAFVDPATNALRELPLTRCIEIWGHAPFGASEREFEKVMDAIERVNAGKAPLTTVTTVPENAEMIDDNDDLRPPSRAATEITQTTAASSTMTPYYGGGEGGEAGTVALSSKTRTGLTKAAASKRETMYCHALNAYIAVPAVPPKYLRWLRQRRAATKEIRNMMLIGRHKNVVHLYEVLEYVQDSKSTMFLVLELVRGGELFDLISSNSASSRKAAMRRGGGEDGGDDDTEDIMRNFFVELASGIAYCHKNGIAHRDLKPENLLVHHGPNDECILKIADFGLSATFALNHSAADVDAVLEAYRTPSLSRADSMWDTSTIYEREKNDTKSGVGASPGPVTGLSPLLNKPMNSISAFGATALSYLTCGNITDVDGVCADQKGKDRETSATPLRRMTSVVGSPHYVAPEIISQADEDDRAKKGDRSSSPGYDGTKADVWSAGVILYAMLFRSLPFGEDLLRCPRYQSFFKWYNEARQQNGRRSSAEAALEPTFDERDEEEMLGPHWFFPSETSMESRDLIVAMLNPNPSQRLSIDMVLKHPWLRPDPQPSNLACF